MHFDKFDKSVIFFKLVIFATSLDPREPQTKTSEAKKKFAKNSRDDLQTIGLSPGLPRDRQRPRNVEDLLLPDAYYILARSRTTY